MLQSENESTSDEEPSERHVGFAVPGERHVGFAEPGERHVGFALDDDGSPEGVRSEDQCRLKRKDTPHFLKGKRITDTDNNKKLQEILQQIENRKNSVDELVDGVNDEESGKIFENSQVGIFVTLQVSSS